MKYFAYGSNMSSERLKARIHSAQAMGIGYVTGHDLRWHKKSDDKSGKCDIFKTDNESDVTWGVIFEISESEKGILDRYEGKNSGHYSEKRVTVILDDESQLEAVTYYANPLKIDPSYLPLSSYKDHVLNGAREFGLPEDYITMIENVETKKEL